MSGPGRTVEEIEVHYRTVIAEKPDDAEAYGWFLAAIYMQGSGRQDEFNEHLSKLWHKDKLFLYKVLGYISGVLMENEHFEGAEQLMKYAISLKPEGYIMHTVLGELYRRTKRFEEAEAAMRKGVELKPKIVDSWIRLGDLYLEMKEYEKAEETLKEGMLIDPESKEALLAWARLVKLSKEHGLKGHKR